MDHRAGEQPRDLRNQLGKRLTDAVDRIFGNRGAKCETCRTAGRRQWGAEYPICQNQLSLTDAVDRCTDKATPLIEALSPIERNALVIFGECWEQWSFAGGGMSALIRVGLPFSDVESAVRSYGLPWNAEIRNLIRKAQNLILEQQNAKLVAAGEASRAGVSSSSPVIDAERAIEIAQAMAG